MGRKLGLLHLEENIRTQPRYIESVCEEGAEENTCISRGKSNAKGRAA
jgi:hypothetical protein